MITRNVRDNAAENFVLKFNFALLRDFVPHDVNQQISEANIAYRFFANICFMLTGIIISKVWSMSHNFKDTSTLNESLKTKNRNDPTILLTNTDDSITQQMHMCNLCDKKYIWLRSLHHHQLQCSNKEPKIRCEFCSKKFYGRNKFKEHLHVHCSSLFLDTKIMKR